MQQLISSAINGDKYAFAELIRSHTQFMTKIAYTILQSEEDVADAISETVLVVFQKLSTLKNPGCFRSWLAKILVNRCKDLLRQKKHYILTDELPEPAKMQSEYSLVEWYETLKCLDEKYRLVVLLYYMEDFSTKEIATALKLPEATVRTRLRRARILLEDSIQPANPESPVNII